MRPITAPINLLLVLLLLMIPCTSTYAQTEFAKNTLYFNSRLKQATKKEVLEVMGKPFSRDQTRLTYLLPETCMVRYEFIFHNYGYINRSYLQDIRCFTITNSPVHHIEHEVTEFF
jgi:hypothetical protein